MQIIINGMLAVLKKNTSFDYVTENYLFTGSDGYTLSITFPLKDCLQNMAIFGWMTRKDVDKNNIIFDCWIRDKNFSKVGAITITEITELEVKAQFLEGRSVQNFDNSFDEIYINELRLGYPTELRPSQITPANAWKQYPLCYAVALPWVNNTSGNMQNVPKYQNGQWSWYDDRLLSFQPYLLHILENICTAIGYTGNFSAIENSEMRYLLICNTLPSAWEAFDYAYALPHWTLTEFFEEMGNFLFGEFVIDHAAQTIDFHFTKSIIESTNPVRIEKVVNAYTVNVSRDKDCDYVGVKNIKYADNDNRFWAYRSCAWYIRENKANAEVFNTLADLLDYAEQFKESGYYEGEGSRSGDLYIRGYKADSEAHKLFYAKDVAMYFIMFCYDAELLKTSTFHDQEFNWYKYYNRLEPINQFGVLEYDKEADELEMSVVPAWIDDTDEEYGPCLFLECGEMGSIVSMEEDDDGEGGTESTVATPSGTFGGAGGTAASGRPNSGINERRASNADVDETDYNAGALAQAKTGKAIEKGERQQSDEYFDCIYMGYWDGTNRNTGKVPYPFTFPIVTNNDFTRVDFPYSLSLERQTSYYDRKGINKIDGKKKYNFSWLSDTIPDVRAVFNIHGKKYLCEKITAQFTERGMSQLLKGVFYRVKESTVATITKVGSIVNGVTAWTIQGGDAERSYPWEGQILGANGYQVCPWTVKVKMGGVDITSSSYNGNTNTIAIANVNGNIEVEATPIKLPSEYRPVEYINIPEAGANSVINTGYIPNNNSKIEIDVKLINVGYPSIFLGTRAANTAPSASATKFNVWIEITSGRGTITWGTNHYSAKTDAKLLTGTRFLFSCDKGVFKYKRSTGADVEKNLNNNVEWQDSAYLRIFGSANQTYYGAGYLWSCVISENGTKIKDFIPVKTASGNVAGLFDRVGQTFIEAAAYYFPAYPTPST